MLGFDKAEHSCGAVAVCGKHVFACMLQCMHCCVCDIVSAHMYGCMGDAHACDGVTLCVGSWSPKGMLCMDMQRST
jgi:hypothetical protein